MSKQQNIGTKVAGKQQVHRWPTAQQSLCVTHTHTHARRPQRACALTMFAVCPHAKEEVRLQLPACAHTKHTVEWNHLTHEPQGPVCSCPRRGLSRNASRWLATQTSCQRGFSHKLWRAAAGMGEASYCRTESQRRKWLLSEIKHTPSYETTHFLSILIRKYCLYCQQHSWLCVFSFSEARLLPLARVHVKG